MSIRLLLADDQELFREGLRVMLSVYPDLEVIGEARHGEEALKQAVKLNPDVVLMDLRMPVQDGVTATRHITAAVPQCRIIILTTFDDEELLFDALRAGATGFLLKDVSSQKLVEAIRAAHGGQSFLHPKAAAKLVAEYTRLAEKTDHGAADLPADESGLSLRERQILQKLALGLGNKAIANALFIAEGTVKNHITNIYQKLGVNSRTQAVLKARDFGLA